MTGAGWLPEDAHAVGFRTDMLNSHAVFCYLREHGPAKAWHALQDAIDGEDNPLSPFVRAYRGRPGGAWWEERREAVLGRDGHTCVYCGSREDIECDHVVPVSRGGGHGFDNLVAACGPCNRSKADKTPDEWRSRRA